MSGCAYFPFQMSSIEFVLIYPQPDSSSVDESSIESEMDQSYATLRLFPTKLPSSNCEFFIILPVCSWDYVAYGIHKTSGCIESDYEYGRDVYDNILDFFVKYNVTRKNYFKCNRYVDEAPFLCCGIPTKMPQKPFCDWWWIFNASMSTFSVDSSTRYGQNKIGGFDTEGFVPVLSLCGVVGSPYLFTKCLIGRTGNIWSLM